MQRGPLAHEREGLHHEVVDGERREVELHAAGLDLGQVEDVTEEGEQVPPGREDVLEVVLLALVEVTEHPLEQHLGEADDGVERGAQLVRHAREELRLVPARLGELDALPLELLVEAGVRQGDGRLAREGGEQLARLLAERPGGLPPDDEGADDAVGTHERDRDERAPARPVQHREVRVEAGRAPRRGRGSGAPRRVRAARPTQVRSMWISAARSASMTSSLVP